MAKQPAIRAVSSFMEETNGGGSPESVEGFNFFRAVTAGFRQDSLGTVILRDRPDAGFFSDPGPNAAPHAPQLEKVIGYDNRKRITDTSLTPWRCICHLEVQYDQGPVGFGTGFLAGESLILTAAHVLVDRSLYGWMEKPRIARRVRVAPGRDASLAPYGAFVCDVPSRGTNHLVPDIWKEQAKSVHDAVTLENAAKLQDFAGLRFDQSVDHHSLGKRLGYFGFRDFSTFEEENQEFLFVNTAGYPHTPDKPYGTLWYNAGRTSAFSEDGRMIDYMVDTEGGQSGSPIYYYDKASNQRQVIAVHTTGDFVNRGLVIQGEVYDRIIEWRGHT